MTVDILLSHGYFLHEDEKELQIMKPYPTLGLLYLSAYLKRAGFDVEVFDTTFATRAELIDRLDAGTRRDRPLHEPHDAAVNSGYRAGRQGARLDGRARRTGERQLSRGVPRARRRRRRHRRGRADAGRAAAGARRARTAPPPRSARRHLPRRGRPGGEGRRRGPRSRTSTACPGPIARPSIRTGTSRCGARTTAWAAST